MLNKNQTLTVIGLGIAVGAMVKVLPLHVLILFAIGLGLVAGGISRELRRIEEKGAGQSPKSSD